MERQSLIFANNQNSQKSILEVLNLMADEVKKIEEVKASDAPMVVTEAPIVKPMSDVNSSYVDNIPAVEQDVINDIDNVHDYEDNITEADKMSHETRQGLPDSDFAVVVTVKNKVTGEPRKIRKFPINDAAHVRNALARLAQPKAQETLKKLGVSVEEVKSKILRRAKELNMTELLTRHQAETQSICSACNTPMLNGECANCKAAKAPKAEEQVLTPDPVQDVEKKVEDVSADNGEPGNLQPALSVDIQDPTIAEPIPAPVDPTPEPVEEPTTTVRKEVEVEVTTVVTDPAASTQTVTEEKTTTVIVDDQTVVEKKETEVTVYTMAQVEEMKAEHQKEVNALKEQLAANDKEVEAIKADLEVVKKEKLEAAKEEPVVLATGHKELDASEESGSAIGKLLKKRRTNRK
jgi:hypothetical protein